MIARLDMSDLSAFANAARCRLCTANDHDGLQEELAARMWEGRRDREIDPDWEHAGLYWQRTMREFAAQTIDMLRADHG